jgi:hypothetical protein
MSKENINITAAGRSYDWSNWLVEQSTEAIRDLAHIAQTMSGRSQLERDQVLSFRDDLAGALARLAKIITFSAGRFDDCPDAAGIAQAILDNPMSGEEDLLWGLGLLQETTAMRETRELCEFAHSIEPLLNGLRGENRTLIYDRLSVCHSRSPVVGAIRDLTEDVTDGVLDWPAYCDSCHRVIALHQCRERHEASTST